jgi:hypothetical protein
MVTKAKSYVTPSAVAQEYDPARPVLAQLEVTKLVREYVPIQSDPNGSSVGAMIDDYLIDTARKGQEVQTIALNFEREQWAAFATAQQALDLPQGHY